VAIVGRPTLRGPRPGGFGLSGSHGGEGSACSLVGQFSEIQRILPRWKQDTYALARITSP
jgi:hypothetical protein